jgi:hypothetical protein
MTSLCSRRAWLADGDLLPPRGGGAAPVFVSHVSLCDVWFTVAWVRLANLIGAGSLTAVSAAAWARGLATLPGLWGRRDDPPAPALARVCLLKPGTGTGIVTLPLRWETAGLDGGLMRVLNAGLTLMPAGPAQTVLRLDGVARLPYTAAHHRSGGMRAHRAAAACAGFLLAGVADALAGPARAGRPETGGDAGHRGHRQVAVPWQPRPPGHDQQYLPPGRAGMPWPALDLGGAGARGAGPQAPAWVCGHAPRHDGRR